jgi:hypothetical protein
MIDERLLIDESRRQHIEFEAAEVQRALDHIKTENKLDDAALDAALKAQRMTRADYLVELERQLLIGRLKLGVLFPQAISDADVTAEARARGLKQPLSGGDELLIRRELGVKLGEPYVAKWLARQRKRVHIRRRP